MRTSTGLRPRTRWTGWHLHGDEYLKVGIAQTLEWDGSDRTLGFLQAKWSTCLAFRTHT